MTVLTDTFDRADADSLGSPWVDSAGDWGVRSSNGRYIGGLEYPGSPGWPGGSNPSVPTAATVDVGSADMVVEWDWTPTSSHIYGLFRFVSTSSSLGIFASHANPNTIYLSSMSGNIASATSVGWQTKRVRVETLGTSIKVYVDGSLTINTTSSTNLTATRAGIGGNAIGWDPTGSFSDNFTRSDASTLGSPWTAHAGTWGIASNRAKFISGSGAGSATVDLGSPVQAIEWNWSALAKGASYQLFRFIDNLNHWGVSGSGLNPGYLSLWYRLGGGYATVATTTGLTWGPGTTLKVEAGETAVKVWNGASLVFNYTSGIVVYGSRAGIGGNMSDAALTTTRWSSFSGEGVDTNSALVPAGSVGPWLNDIDWTRFYCSPWPIPARNGWAVGRLAW